MSTSDALVSKIQEELTPIDMDQRYDDMLDELYPELFGLLPSRILKECDPIQYNCGFSDWEDSELNETVVEVNGEYYDKAEVDELEDSLDEEDEAQAEAEAEAENEEEVEDEKK